MQDRPDARELTEAVAEFLEREILPALNDQRLRFRALVAANVLKILARELEAGDAPLRAEWRRLARLLNRGADMPARAEELRGAVLQMNRELAARIRAGEADEAEFFNAALAHAEATAIEKLQIANPRYLRRVRSSSGDTN
jgi:hypothetical protein